METIKKLALIVLITVSFASCIVVQEPRHRHYYHMRPHHHWHHGYRGR